MRSFWHGHAIPRISRSDPPILSGDSRPVAATLCRGEPILRDTASQTVPDLPAPVVQ
jgi:hypothetical protein